MSRSGAWLSLIGGLLFLAAAPGRGDAPPADVKGGAPPPGAAVDSNGDLLPRGARARLGTVRFRHGGPVETVRCLPDGKTLISYGADQVLRYWEAASGRELRHVRLGFDLPDNRAMRMMINRGIDFPMPGFPGGQMCACVSADGRLVVVADGGGGNVLKVRDVLAGKVVRELKLDKGTFHFACLSPDDKVVAAAVGDQNPNNGNQTGSIRRWEIATGKELKALVGPEPKEGLQRFAPNYFFFAPDGSKVAAVGTEFNNRNGIVRVWDLGKDAEPVRLVEHGGAVGPLVFSPDGKLLADVSANPVTAGNARLRLWDAATGREARDLGEHPNGSAALVFSADGKLLADIDLNNQTPRVWDVATGKAAVSLELNGAAAVAFAPDGRTLAVGLNDGTLRLHEVGSGKELHQMKGFQAAGAGQFGSVGGQGLGQPITFAPDGRTLFGPGGNVVRRWDALTGKEIPAGDEGPESNLAALAYAPDGKALLTSGDGLRSWDLAKLRPTELLPAMKGEDDDPPAVAPTFALSPDGKTLAVGWNNGKVTLAEAATGKELRRLEGAHDAAVLSLVFAGDGKTLLSSGFDGRVVWWDAATGKQLRLLSGTARPAEEPPPGVGPAPPPEQPGAAVLALTADGGTVAGAGMEGGSFKVRFWELATGKLRRQLVVDNLAGDLDDRARLGLDEARPAVNVGGVPQLAFAPDGKHFAVGSGPNIELRELRRGREVRQYNIYGTLTAVRFSPDGALLAGASDDGSIRLWDVAAGTVRAELRGHRGGVTALAFAPDGRSLASAGGDGTVVFWDVRRCLEKEVPAGRLSAQELDDVWKDLAGDDAEKAFRSGQRLADAPEQAVALLRERLKPVPVVDAKKLAQLVADLEHDRPAQRKRAAAELEKLGELAEPALRKRLGEDAPLDLKQQIEKLLGQLAGPTVAPEQVRALRALEVLETAGTPEARQLLQQVADGAPEARVTKAARAALKRLAPRE